MPLTDVAIRAARPAARPLRLFDALGLYLEISPAGGRWWRLKYRFGGKERRISLGTYPETGLRQARERRDEARRILAGGADPGAQRRAERAGRAADAVYTVRRAAADWLAYKASGWKAGTSEAIAASLANHVYPALGDRPAASITGPELRAVVRAVDAAGAGETAGRLLQRLRSIFRHAVGEGRIQADPAYALRAADIIRPRRVAHRASLPIRELPALLRQIDSYGGDAVTQAALGLLLLTVVRPAELRGAAWAEIEWDAALWRIPGPRMKMQTEHLVPLSRQALALLRRLEPLTGAGPLILPSPFYPGKALSEGTLNSALSRMGYKGIATAHGFRTTFSTAANEAGHRADAIERQLSHEERDDVRGAYNRAEYLAERVAIMQWWADRLDQLRRGGDVVPLRAHASK